MVGLCALVVAGADADAGADAGHAWIASAADFGICSLAAAAAAFYPVPTISVFVLFSRNILLG